MVKERLTTHEVALCCHVNMSTVVNWIEDGSLKAYRTKGGHRRVKRDDLLDFMAEHKMPLPSNKRVLIVDDDESIRSGLKELFESEGYEVDTAVGGFEAGVLLQMKKPSVIILDLVMPGMDGFEVCEYISQQKSLKHTMVIVLTGYPSKDNIKKAKEAGANKCIAKPVDNLVILKEVKNLAW